jgi:antitoxin ParD1/3/4
MPQRNVNLTEHFDEFIDTKIESGRFSNASEMVREGLRLLEVREREDEARIAWLRTAATDAFASLDRGEGLRFESMEELDATIMGISEEVFSEAVVSEP